MWGQVVVVNVKPTVEITLFFGTTKWEILRRQNAKYCLTQPVFYILQSFVRPPCLLCVLLQLHPSKLQLTFFFQLQRQHWNIVAHFIHRDNRQQSHCPSTPTSLPAKPLAIKTKHISKHAVILMFGQAIWHTFTFKKNCARYPWEHLTHSLFGRRLSQAFFLLFLFRCRFSRTFASGIKYACCPWPHAC